MPRWRPNCSPRRGTSSPPCWPRATGALLSHGTAAWRWRIIPAPPSVIDARRAADAHGTRGRERSSRAATCAQATAPTTAASPPPPSHAPSWTSPPATTAGALLRALAEAEFQHDLRPADVERTLRRGHPGSANLRAALHEHAPGPRRDEEPPGAPLPRAAHPPRHRAAVSATSPSGRGRSTACGASAASSSSSTGASTSVPTRPTATTTATSGCAATATWPAATASDRSSSGPTTSSPTSSTRSPQL